MDDDRFTFGADFEVDEPETSSKGGGSNRVFVIVAIGLIGLIIIGLLGIAGYWALIRPRAQEKANTQNTQVVAEATAVAQQTLMVPTDTPVPTHTPVPTNTPVPTPTPRATNTPVIRPTDTAVPGAVPTPTRTPVGGGQTPQTGIGGLTAVLAAAVLVVIIFAARRLRLAG